MGDADVRRALLGRRVQRAVPAQPGEGPDRAVGGLRPPDPDRLRPGPRALPRRGRQGGRAGQPPGRPPRPVRRHPAHRDQHLDDHQRDRDVALRPVRDGGPGAGRGRGRRRRGGGRGAWQAGGHDPERHPQGVPVARHLRLPARRLDAADDRPDRAHRDRGAAVQPDQHLQLPPAGGRCDPGAGARLRDVDGDRGARRRTRCRPGARGAFRRRRRPHLLLRQRRRALRRGDVQDARPGADLGRDHPGPLRRHRPEGPAAAVRRAGQLARADRGAAREQRRSGSCWRCWP